MKKNTITLINKMPYPYKVNYPYQLNEGYRTSWTWSACKNGRPSEVEIPIQVYEWLVDSTTCLKNGMLVVKKPAEVNEETEEIVDVIERFEEVDVMNGAIKTEAELIELFGKGNQNVLKKNLNELIEGIEDEDVIQQIKKYVFMVACNNKIDSKAKAEVVATWCGEDYDEVKDRM